VASWIDWPFNHDGGEPTSDEWAAHWERCCREAAEADIVLMFACAEERQPCNSAGSVPRFFASDPTFAAPREIPSRNRAARFRLGFSVVAAILTACCCVPAAPSNGVKQLRRWASVPKPADA
jgi:hypothetical protein